MAYELKRDETISHGLRRIVRKQIDKALENLRPTVISKDEAIHDARVCIKKIRAILRLSKHSLGKDIFDQEDAAYRDAARALSKVRDSAAMLEVLDKLIEHFSETVAHDVFESVRAPLMHSKKVRQQARSSAMTSAAKALRQARQRVDDWPRVGHRQTMRDLKLVFKRGRASFAKAYDQPSVENFHKWRKQVKHLLYLSRVLRPLWRKMMGAMAAELKALGKFLSEDHDLALLREKVSEQLEETENRDEISALVALIDQRRNELQAIAGVSGERIYGEKPSAFMNRIETYWQAWKSETKVEP
jgi:CHAD domain-containing protein